LCHHHLAFREVACSGLIHPELSSVVCPDFLCLLFLTFQ
jgi:hypothetical protein